MSSRCYSLPFASRPLSLLLRHSLRRARQRQQPPTAPSLSRTTACTQPTISTPPLVTPAADVVTSPPAPEPTASPFPSATSSRPLMRTATSSSSRYSSYSSSTPRTTRSVTSDHRSAVLPSSRCSEWLSSYDEVWEDGTGADYVDGAQPQSIDYFYLADDSPMAPADALAVEAEAVREAVTEEAAAVDTATFPAEWFGSKRRRVVEDERISEEEEGQEEEADTNQLQDALVEDEAYASHLVGLAMLGLYCTQGIDEAESEAAASDPPVPLPLAPSTTSRTPSSRTREEHNVTNPILIRHHHHSTSRTSPSTPTSSSPSPTGSSSVPSPVLSPLASSPTLTGSGSRSALSLSTAAAASSGSSPSGDSSDEDGGNGRRRFSPSSSYDPSIHLHAKKRLSRAIDARSLSDKAQSQRLTSSPSSDAEQRLHHERFAQLVQVDGSLALSVEELPSLAAWTHLGSFLLLSPRVISLSFRSMPITEACLEALGRSVLASVRSLVFSDNRIGLHPSTLAVIVQLLSSCLQLQSLAITRNSLTDADAVWRLLESHRQLRSLSLADNGLDTAAALGLANAIRRIAHSHQPSTSSRRSNRADREEGGAEMQSPELSLTVDLSYNRIDQQGEAALKTAREELARITQGRVEVELLLHRLPRSPFFVQSATLSSASASPLLPPLSLPSSASWSWLANRSSRMVSQLMMSRATSATAGVTVPITVPPVAFSLSRYASLPSLATSPRPAQRD